MKISFSCNTILKNALIVSKICKLAREQGHVIWISTGYPLSLCERNLKIIDYDNVFSIVDYHKSIGTQMWQGEKGWHMNKDFWNPTKGEWAKRENIDLHLDECEEYEKYFPESCEFFLTNKNFDKRYALIINKIMGITS